MSDTAGESTVADVVLQQPIRIVGIPEMQVFREHERLDAYLQASPGEFRGQLRREHVGIGTGHVDIGTVNVERGNRVLPFRYVLDLVEEQICAPDIGNLRRYGIHQLAERLYASIHIVEVGIEYPVVGYSGFPQFIHEHLHQGGLPASADAREDLDERCVAGLAHPRHIVLSGNQVSS